MSTHDDPKASTTLIAGLIGTILLLAIIVLAQVMFYNVQRLEEQAKVYAPPAAELRQIESEQLAQITTYRWINQQDGVVAIPIDRAITLYASEVKSGVESATIKRSARESGTTTQSASPE